MSDVIHPNLLRPVQEVGVLGWHPTTKRVEYSLRKWITLIPLDIPVYFDLVPGVALDIEVNDKTITVTFVPGATTVGDVINIVAGLSTAAELVTVSGDPANVLPVTFTGENVELCEDRVVITAGLLIFDHETGKWIPMPTGGDSRREHVFDHVVVVEPDGPHDLLIPLPHPGRFGFELHWSTVGTRTYSWNVYGKIGDDPWPAAGPDRAIFNIDLWVRPTAGSLQFGVPATTGGIIARTENPVPCTEVLLQRTVDDSDVNDSTLEVWYSVYE